MVVRVMPLLVAAAQALVDPAVLTAKVAMELAMILARQRLPMCFLVAVAEGLVPVVMRFLDPAVKPLVIAPAA